MHAAAILKDCYVPVPLLLPGAYLVLLTDDELLSIEARIAGLHLRDTLLVLGPGRRSRFGFLFRSPTTLTIAEQVLATGTGGMNIDACRTLGGNGTGRWPTNVTFIHTRACERVHGTVAAWTCTQDCLAGALDRQSGDRPSTLTGRADPLKAHEHPSRVETASWYSGGAAKDTQVYADFGGASRFYTQFPNEDQFLDWLGRLITPNGGLIFNREK